MVGAMKYMGRLWWCACGQPRLWGGAVNSEHNSQHLFDWYSLSHVLHGFIFYWALSPINKIPGIKIGKRWLFLAAITIEAAWEVLENSPIVIDRYRQTIAQGYTGDTVVNSLGDLLACGLGFWIAYLLGWKKTLIIFIIIELAMLYFIRDNLTLNVIALIYPMDSLTQWQQGG
ncbi:DUF2585 family protein [Planctomycetota bacterium]|nr:DUF2585 family protein [Planctomycetota bacterium]